MSDELPAVEDLHFGSLHAGTHEADWNAEAMLDDRWTYYEAFTYEDSAGREHLLIASNGSVVAVMVNGRAYERYEFEDYADEPGYTLDEEGFEALFELGPYQYGAEGPMMNYWYECADAGDDPVRAAVALRHLPLCVVQVDGEWGLALTGGGMDLTWEIVEAYVRLGQLPPVDRASSLPAMSGRGKSERDQHLIAACRRSLEAAAERTQYSLSRLDEQAQRWAEGECY